MSDSMGTLTVLARYTLNREAAEVELEFYGPDLELLGSLTGQSVDAGANWSDVETLTGVQYDANGDLVGPIHCVAFATETTEDGELNRDLQPKPALQKGTTFLQSVGALPTPMAGKVLISAKHGGGYPLEEQAEDRKIEITFDWGPLWSGHTAYFKSFDPPDLSPYNDSTAWDDNPDGAGSVSPTSAVIDQEGNASTVLTITNKYSGSNYVVASCVFGTPTQDTAEKLFAAGHNLVAWKRVYIEEAQMYRQGTDLAQDATQGQDTLVLESSAGIGPGTVLHLFDASNREGEQVEVEAVNGTTIELTETIQNSYSTASGAAMGVPSAGFYTANRELLAGNAYGESSDGTDGGTFVEFLRQPQDRMVVPYRAYFADFDEMHDFRHTWFVNKNQSNYLCFSGPGMTLGSLANRTEWPTRVGTGATSTSSRSVTCRSTTHTPRTTRSAISSDY